MGLFTCNYCGFQANMKPMVDHHLLSVHKYEEESEDENKLDFGTNLDLKEAIEDIKDTKLEQNLLDNEKKLSCILCDFTTKHKGHLVNHDKNHIKKTNQVKLTYLCEICDYIGSSYSNLQYHKTKSICFRYKCASCSFKTSIKGNLSEHDPRTCKMDIDPNNKGHAVCDNCDYRANTFGQIKLHKKKRKCYDLVCKYCPFKTSMVKCSSEHKASKICKTKTSWNQVKFKITNIEAKGRYPCGTCDYKGNSYANLQFHQTKSICFRHSCEHCEYKTSVLNNLKGHEVEKNHFRHKELVATSITDSKSKGKPSYFVCKECDYKGTEIQMYNYHIRKKNCWRFKCLTCNFKTSLQKNFGDHKRKEGKAHIYRKWNETMRKKIESRAKIEKPKAEYICPTCDYKGHYLFKLEKHRTIGCYWYKCIKCDFKTSLRSMFVDHKEKTWHSQRAGPKMVNCTHCDFNTGAKSDLRKHLTSSKGCFRYICDFNCGFRTSMVNEFRTHRMGHGLGDGKHLKEHFSCSKCDYVVGVLDTFLKHDGNCYRFKCNFCSYKTSIRKKIGYHRIKEQHNKAVRKFSYACSKCDFQCPYPKGLKQHRKEKNKCLKFLCPHCYFRTSMKSLIVGHKQNCSKQQTSLTCSNCDFKAEKETILLKHKRLSCYPYVCTICEFKTSIWKELTLHKEESHSITAFECQKCDYIAKAKSLSEHTVLKTKHEEVGCYRYNCLSCDYKTSKPNTMGLHRGKAHNRRENKAFYEQFKESLSQNFS